MTEQETIARFERIEANLEKHGDAIASIDARLDRMAAENERFQAAVRGAITTQQQQIAEVTATIGNLGKQMEAYLRRLPPQ